MSRLPGERLETAIADAIISTFGKPTFSTELLHDPDANEIAKTNQCVHSLIADLQSERRNDLLKAIVSGGSISKTAIAVELCPDAMSLILGCAADRINRTALSITASCQLRRRGVEMQLLLGDAKTEADQNLVQKIALGVDWFARIKAGGSIKAIAKANSVSPDRVAQIMRLAWLSPDLVEKIIAGDQPDRLTANTIFKSPHIALWNEQRAWAAGL